jgi:hypothetical protein
LPLRFLVLLGCRSAEVFLGFSFFFPSRALHFLRRAVFWSECFVSAAVFRFHFQQLLGFSCSALVDFPLEGYSSRASPRQGSWFALARVPLKVPIFSVRAQGSGFRSSPRVDPSTSWFHQLPLHLVLIPWTARAGAATDLLWPLSASVAFS